VRRRRRPAWRGDATGRTLAPWPSPALSPPALTARGDLAPGRGASAGPGPSIRVDLLTQTSTEANCPILDEPTKHLDIPAAEALEGSDGTVIAVSHDRSFLDRIADRIVDVRDGEVRAYEGGFSAWERARAAR
jgi:ABC-type transport system involved in cytochrome bd biosynthesis fused ATPase/permease subunit